MKSTTLSSRIALVVLVIFAACVPSFAGTSGDLALSGTVAQVINLTITPDTANTTSLPILAGTGAAGLKIASLVELSNVKAGYTVKVTSINGYKLVQAFQSVASGGDSVPYTFIYNGVAITPTGTVTRTETGTGGKSVAGGTSKDLSIVFGASTILNADSYSDTLTITIAGK